MLWLFGFNRRCKFQRGREQTERNGKIQFHPAHTQISKNNEPQRNVIDLVVIWEQEGVDSPTTTTMSSADGRASSLVVAQFAISCLIPCRKEQRHHRQPEQTESRYRTLTLVSSRACIHAAEGPVRIATFLVARTRKTLSSSFCFLSSISRHDPSPNHQIPSPTKPEKANHRQPAQRHAHRAIAAELIT